MQIDGRSFPRSAAGVPYDCPPSIRTDISGVVALNRSAGVESNYRPIEVLSPRDSPVSQVQYMLKLPLWITRRFRRFCIALVSTVPVLGVTAPDCLDSDIAKRFRETSGPGVVAGLGNAVQNPQNAEEGLREAAAAFFQGLGGIVQPRTPSSRG